MRNQFAERLALTAVPFVLTFALTSNVICSAGVTHTSVVPVAPQIAHSPTLPPDPWDGTIAHSPTLPPDPWDGTIAHSPTLPPDPWDGTIAHSPTLPPDPWDGTITA